MEETPSATSSASSSSCTLSIPRKVCMIFPAPYPEFEYGHDIYILDLNTNLGSFNPTIRVVGEGFRSAAFCVLGSILYVFEGHDGKSPRRGKTVSCYDFSGHQGGEAITLSGRKDLKWVCKMKDIKFRPRVTPTPDGKKIVVFSTEFDSFGSSSSSNFELFDPSPPKPNCKILPDLFRSPPFSYHIGWVQLSSFLNQDVLFVQTSLTSTVYRSGMYQLNLNLVDQGSCWEPFYFQEQLRINDEFKVIGDDICLTPEIVLRINVPGLRETESSNRNWFYQLPRRPLSDGFSPPPHVSLQKHIALLDNHPQDRLFCVLRKWLSEEEEEEEVEAVEISQDDDDDDDDDDENKSVTYNRYVPRIILDVYKCNLPACKKEMLEFEEKQREKFKSDMLAELEEKQQREKMMVELEEKQQREKMMVELEEKQRKEKLISNRNNQFMAEIIEFEKYNDFFLTIRSIKIQENLRSLSRLSEEIKRMNRKNKKNIVLTDHSLVKEYIKKRAELEDRLDWKNMKSKLVVTEKRVDFEQRETTKSNNMKRNVVVSTELPGTELVNMNSKVVATEKKIDFEQRETIKSNNMKRNEVVSTELPGTELVKSFQIEFKPQPPPTFIFRRIFPLHNFFSIPT